MHVQNINKYSSNAYSPKFSGVYRDVCAGQKIMHRNVSWMFRPSFNECKRFYSYISDVFRDIPKVNVYSYGCSLGYEAYGFVIGMFAEKEKNPEKFFPIIAKDYDEAIIGYAKKNIIPLETTEIKQIGQMFNNDANKISEFITFTDRLKILSKLKFSQSLYDNLAAQGDTLGTLSGKLTDNVKFFTADIRTDYKNIKPQNSIVLASNFWPYMSDEDRYALAKNLSEQLEQNCYVKVDKFDNGMYPGKSFVPTADLLLQNGFKWTPVLNLFRK